MPPIKTLTRRAATLAGRIVNAPLQVQRRHTHGLLKPVSRAQFLAGITARPALEIGPFDNPQLKGSGVAYFDTLTKSELEKRALVHGRTAGKCPAIDFVSPTGDLSVVNGTFKAVFSSHAVEHQPDLVEHLRQVTGILQPNGCYYLIVPDKRYCFDYYLRTTTIEDVLAASRERRRIHTETSVREHTLETTHNDARLHWLGWHGRPDRSPSRLQFAHDSCVQVRAGNYVDVHAWKFTPQSFKALIQQMNARGLTSLQVDHVHDSAFGTQEFFAVLKTS